VEGIGNWSYDERLKYLGLTRLDTRRIRSDLIETFRPKIINGLYDVNREMFFKLDISGRRGHNMKLFNRRFRLDVRKLVFSNKVVDHMNVLSQCSINCNSINTFKKHIAHDLELRTVKI